MPVLGLTALVPPELVYACGHTPLDLNNFVPVSNRVPKNKLCAWTAIWREMLLKEKIDIDSLVVVAGGDCHNALVDGQKVERYAGLDTHYFFYPFSGDEFELLKHLNQLVEFLGGVKDEGKMKTVSEIKEVGLQLDMMRSKMAVRSSDAFGYLVAGSDLGQDPQRYKDNINELLRQKYEPNRDFKRIALIGVPPIYPDFHTVCEELGLFVVYDELPFEFLRLGGSDIKELAMSYSDYSFARPLDHRLKVIKKELDSRQVEGVVHYTQYACHHCLEDDMFRGEIDLPILTIQGDLPRCVDEQLKLRLEAFYESL
jgi:benzoyl-CoA reductase/2-hydroxyglutaryl-CoA dehydratase subunit BcrC/BadD/HgdB